MPEEDEKFDLSAFDEADEEDTIVVEKGRPRSALEQQMFEAEQNRISDIEAMEQAIETGDLGQMTVAGAPFGVTDDLQEQKDPGEVAAEVLGEVGEAAAEPAQPKPKAKKEAVEAPPEGMEAVYVPSTVDEFLEKEEDLDFNKAMGEAVVALRVMRKELGVTKDNKKKLDTELSDLQQKLEDTTDDSTRRKLRQDIESKKAEVASAEADIADRKRRIKDAAFGSRISVFQSRGRPYVTTTESTTDPLRHIDPAEPFYPGGVPGQMPGGAPDREIRQVPGTQYMMDQNPEAGMYIPLMEQKGTFFSRDHAEQWKDIAEKAYAGGEGQFSNSVLPDYFSGKKSLFKDRKPLGIHNIDPIKVGEGKDTVRVMDSIVNPAPIRLAYGYAAAEMETSMLNTEMAQIASMQKDIEDQIGYTNEELQYHLRNKGDVTLQDVRMFVRSATSLSDPEADKFLQAAVWLDSEDGERWKDLHKARLERSEARTAIQRGQDLYADRLERRHGISIDMIKGKTGLPAPYTYHYQVWGDDETRQSGGKWGYGGHGNELTPSISGNLPGPAAGDLWMQHTLELLTGVPTYWYGQPETEGQEYTRGLTEKSRQQQDKLAEANPVWAYTYWYTFSDHDPSRSHQLRRQLYNNEFGQYNAPFPSKSLTELRR